MDDVKVYKEIIKRLLVHVDNGTVEIGRAHV